MDNDKSEVRFLLPREIYKKLQKEAKDLDIPLASYIKANIEVWKNGR